jgi:CIC family chloride channel protein
MLKSRIFENLSNILPILAAIIVGLFSGIGVWVFKHLIEFFTQLWFVHISGQLQILGKLHILLLPVSGGLIVGWIVKQWIGTEKYHGLPGIIEACALRGARLPYSKMPIRVLAAAISIGCGASVGPEDPSVQVGTNIGSLVGQIFRFSEQRIRSLVAGGAAAGIASAFNAPIAGIFFALEVLLGQLDSASFSYAAIAAVSASIFTQIVSGSQPAFAVVSYGFGSLIELPFYLILGILSGPLAAIYIRLMDLSRRTFHKLIIPTWLHPAIAGLFVGLTGVFLPQVFGVGYQTIETLLSGLQFSLPFLIALLLAKLLLTPLSIGSGYVGGVFAPSLFLGAVLGGAFGEAVQQLFPNLQISTPAFVLVGMAAVLASTIRAPLTATLLLFEMTQDYHIILPLVFAMSISLFLSRAIEQESVYTMPLARDNIRLHQGRDIEILESIQIQEVMTPVKEYLNETQTLREATEILYRTHHHGLPVLNNAAELIGIFTLQELEKSDPQMLDQITVGQQCTRTLITAYPNQSIGIALQKMSQHDIGRLPIVSPDNPSHLLGILRRSDIIRAYELAIARRAELRHRSNKIQLGVLNNSQIQEITIHTGSACANKVIQSIPWPQGCIITGIRRGTQTIIPHGNTHLRPGDTLIVLGEPHEINSIQALASQPAEAPGI